MHLSGSICYFLCSGNSAPEYGESAVKGDVVRQTGNASEWIYLVLGIQII